MTASDSIVQGATPTKSNAGLLGTLLPPNTATLTLARTDQTTPPDALFVSTARRNYHLRADAPVIDKGGPAESGDSETDLDGQPRIAGAASDLGADEFGNTPPTAMIELKTAVPRTGQPVTFDGSASTDRETAIGGPIAEYRWTFGDGISETTTTPTVEHTYSREGALVAQLVVVDRQGAASTPAAVPVRLAPARSRPSSSPSPRRRPSSRCWPRSARAPSSAPARRSPSPARRRPRPASRASC